MSERKRPLSSEEVQQQKAKIAKKQQQFHTLNKKIHNLVGHERTIKANATENERNRVYSVVDKAQRLSAALNQESKELERQVNLAPVHSLTDSLEEDIKNFSKSDWNRSLLILKK